MDERLQFVARRLAGEGMAELCREFGISRKTGYMPVVLHGQGSALAGRLCAVRKSESAIQKAHRRLQRKANRKQMITRPEHSNLLTEEPCPMNHQPLGYEPSRINDTYVFQRLDVAGNDTESLKRHESTVIGPQSDHILGIVQAVEASSADVAG